MKNGVSLLTLTREIEGLFVLGRNGSTVLGSRDYAGVPPLSTFSLTPEEKKKEKSWSNMVNIF